MHRSLITLALILAACSTGELIETDALVDPPEEMRPDAVSPDLGSVDPTRDAALDDGDGPRDAEGPPVDLGGGVDLTVGDDDLGGFDAAVDVFDAAPVEDMALEPDLAPDAAPLAACAALEGAGWTTCHAGADRCEGVFTDGRGCAAACARAGLACEAVYENVDGMCAADLARPALACVPGSGHDSDYCVCVPGRPTEPWEDLAGAAVGYGRGAIGGFGGDVCTVSNLADIGAGSLRACAEGPGPRWIRFAVSGDINLQSMIQVGSDKTIDGRGAAIRIRNRGLRLSGVHNVIIHNVRFDDGGGDNEDALQIINGASDVWVDHVTFEDFTDGLLDITVGATNVTVSWCRFRDHDKTMLIGSSVDHVGDEVIRVTLHHNWFDGTNQRHPRLRYGKVHVFNNYYRSWGAYGIGASQRGEVRSQRNIFEAGANRDAITTRVGDDPESGRVRSDNDRRLNGASISEREADRVFEPGDDYGYVLEAADDALRDRIRNGAGWRQVGMP
ncbi:MAG: polysaccharide lyase family 1 protein [bacterium]